MSCCSSILPPCVEGRLQVSCIQLSPSLQGGLSRAPLMVLAVSLCLAPSDLSLSILSTDTSLSSSILLASLLPGVMSWRLHCCPSSWPDPLQHIDCNSNYWYSIVRSLRGWHSWIVLSRSILLTKQMLLCSAHCLSLVPHMLAGLLLASAVRSSNDMLAL